MQNNSSIRRSYRLSSIAGFALFALIVTALGFAFLPNIAEAVPDMYVANYNNDTISRANLDGTGGVSLGNLGGTLNEPHGIALDLRQTGLAVPTLSEWGMIALSLLMAGSAILIMRRRKLVTT